MSADGGFAACRIRWRSHIRPPLIVSCNLSGDLQSGSVCPPHIISHFILFPFSKYCTSSVSFINFSSFKTLAGPRPPFPLLHLHLGSTRLPKCFLGVRWLIGSHLLGESGLYGILGNLCQEFYHIDLVFSLCPEFTDRWLFFFVLLQRLSSVLSGFYRKCSVAASG